MCLNHRCKRECDKTWECGPSPWHDDSTTCGTCKNEPDDDPDAGVCWENLGTCGVVTDAGTDPHTCVYQHKKCEKKLVF